LAARRDSKFCGKACRQRAWRFARPARERRAVAPAGARDASARAATCPSRVDGEIRPRRFAYADPPYPGLAARYYSDHPDFAGEVDHAELLTRLAERYPDGWALSTSSRTLREVLALCPSGVRVGVWTKPAPPGYTRHARRAWEPVIFCGGRPLPRDGGTVLDWVHVAPPREHPGRVVGIKPSGFSWWVFENLGAAAGDTLDDLFPGSGAVGRAWDLFQAEASRATAASRDASRAPRDSARARQLMLAVTDPSRRDRAATAAADGENGALSATQSA
jgi:hypothetical protein